MTRGMEIFWPLERRYVSVEGGASPAGEGWLLFRGEGGYFDRGFSGARKRGQAGKRSESGELRGNGKDSAGRFLGE